MHLFLYIFVYSVLSFPTANEDELVGQQIGKYQVTRILGSGQYGIVYEGQDTLSDSDARFALKTGTTNAKIKKEASILSKVQGHPNICKYIDYIYHEDKSFLVMPKYEGDLGQLLLDYKHNQRKMSEIQIKDLIRQVISAVKHVHSRGYYHMDIKPDNIFYSIRRGNKGPQYSTYLCDFGQAKRSDLNKANSKQSPFKRMVGDGSKVDAINAAYVIESLISGLVTVPTITQFSPNSFDRAQDFIQKLNFSDPVINILKDFFNSDGMDLSDLEESIDKLFFLRKPSIRPRYKPYAGLDDDGRRKRKRIESSQLADSIVLYESDKEQEPQARKSPRKATRKSL